MDARFSEIQQTILDAVAAEADLSALEILTDQEAVQVSADNTSVAGIWRRLVWIFSYAMWNHEKVVAANAENSRPHTIRWYHQQVLAFLDGLALVWKDGQFQYDTTGIDDLEARQIIDRCAVLESNDGELVIKIATDNAGTIEPLSAPQLTRFTAYMQQIKDAGNRLRIINQEADQLKMSVTAYVDVTIIDLATGKLLNTPDDVYPVQDAIDSYLANLEFNGAFVKSFCQDEMQAAEGVKLPLITDLQWKYAGFAFQPVVEIQKSIAGYFKFLPGDLTITYLPYELA